jgi:2-aminoadipate transaminase
VVGGRDLIDRMAARKQSTDLHSDQLSQAVLLRFAESGRLARHKERLISMGRDRIHALLANCAQHLAQASLFVRPEGGMNVWLRLPRGVDASILAERGLDSGVAFLPGRYFAVSGAEPGGLRLSFAHLPASSIGEGIARLGKVLEKELARSRAAWRDDPAPAIV